MVNTNVSTVAVFARRVLYWPRAHCRALLVASAPRGIARQSARLCSSPDSTVSRSPASPSAATSGSLPSILLAQTTYARRMVDALAAVSASATQGSRVVLVRGARGAGKRSVLAAILAERGTSQPHMVDLRSAQQSTSNTYHVGLHLIDELERCVVNSVTSGDEQGACGSQETAQAIVSQLGNRRVELAQLASFVGPSTGVSDVRKLSWSVSARNGSDEVNLADLQHALAQSSVKDTTAASLHTAWACVRGAAIDLDAAAEAASALIARSIGAHSAPLVITGAEMTRYCSLATRIFQKILKAAGESRTLEWRAPLLVVTDDALFAETLSQSSTAGADESAVPCIARTVELCGFSMRALRRGMSHATGEADDLLRSAYERAGGHLGLLFGGARAEENFERDLEAVARAAIATTAAHSLSTRSAVTSAVAVLDALVRCGGVLEDGDGLRQDVLVEPVVEALVRNGMLYLEDGRVLRPASRALLPMLQRVAAKLAASLPRHLQTTRPLWSRYKGARISDHRAKFSWTS